MASNTISKFVFRGLVLAAPIAVTIWTVSFLVNFADGLMGPLVRSVVSLVLPSPGIQYWICPLISLLILGAAVSLLGAMVEIWIGKKLVDMVHYVFETVPLVRKIFTFCKKMFEVFNDSGEGGGKFTRVVAFRTWADGTISIGLVSGETRCAATGKKLLIVFNPIQSPTPIGGQNLIIEEDKTWDPGWTTEEAFQFLMTMGARVPSKIVFSRS